MADQLQTRYAGASFDAAPEEEPEQRMMEFEGDAEMTVVVPAKASAAPA